MFKFLRNLLGRAAVKMLTGVSVGGSGGGWLNIVRESYAGAFQQHVVVDGPKDILAFSGVFAPATLITGDVAKMRVRLVEEDADGICTELERNSPFWTPLLKPNHYQNRIQFWSQWIMSKLLWGNTYVLKEREPGRGMVQSLYVLDPARVKPLIADNGDVYYELSVDHLRRLIKTVIVPATEIIHDRWNCLWHDLVGISPIYACAVSATQGRRIQNDSTTFFANLSRPAGILTAPGTIQPQDAEELKRRWNENYGGERRGDTAVLGAGLKYESISQPAEQSQLIEQLGWTKFDCADCFHVPRFKVGGDVPVGSTIEALNLMYYTDCLQTLIEAAELCLDEGLEVKENYYTEFDLDGLIRMDQTAQMKVLGEGVKGGIMAPDEARAKLNLPAVPGGDSVYLQQQNFSLDALAKRDAKDDPFAKEPASTPAAPAREPANDDDRVAAFGNAFVRGLMEDTIPLPTPALLMEADSQIRASAGILVSLASTVAESQKRVDSTLEAVVASARHTEESQARVAHSVDELTATLKMPVKPIFDKEGRFKGGKRVEKLEDE